MNLLEKLLELHRRRRWLAHGLFWLAVLLIGVSSSKYFDGNKGTYWFEFVSDALYEIPEILAAYAVTYWVFPQFLYRRRYLAAVLSFVAIAYLACVLGRIFIVKVDEPLAGIAPKAFETYWAILTDLPKLLYVYFFQIFSIVFVFLCLKTLKHQLAIQRRALMLEKEKAETELKLLKAQLNPHFLFNTLNNIYSLSFISPERTSESIAQLANILDHILYRSQQRFVPLSQEIGLIRNYIELEKLRYDQRLTINFSVETNSEIGIAPLVLLSLVENAFKHGAGDDTGEPVIDIRLTVSDATLQFEIANTVGMEKERAATAEPIGLNNLRQQLHHLYGADHELSVSREAGWFRVGLTIHLKLDEARYEKDALFAGG
jgi:two-component sensor histidine kinase